MSALSANSNGATLDNDNNDGENLSSADTLENLQDDKQPLSTNETEMELKDEDAKEISCQETEGEGTANSDRPEEVGTKPDDSMDIEEIDKDTEEFVIISSTYKDNDGKPNKPHISKYRIDRRGTQTAPESKETTAEVKETKQATSKLKTQEIPKKRLEVSTSESDSNKSIGKLFPNSKHNRYSVAKRTLSLGPISFLTLTDPHIDEVLKKSTTISATWKTSQRTKNKEGNLSLHFLTMSDMDGVKTKLKDRSGKISSDERIYIINPDRASRQTDMLSVEWEKALFPYKPDSGSITTVYIHNLPLKTRRHTLYELFPTACGAVLPLTEDGSAIGYALVKFLTLADAKSSCKEPRTVDGQKLSMFIIEKPRGQASERKSTIFSAPQSVTSDMSSCERDIDVLRERNIWSNSQYYDSHELRDLFIPAKRKRNLRVENKVKVTKVPIVKPNVKPAPKAVKPPVKKAAVTAKPKPVPVKKVDRPAPKRDIISRRQEKVSEPTRTKRPEHISNTKGQAGRFAQLRRDSKQTTSRISTREQNKAISRTQKRTRSRSRDRKKPISSRPTPNLERGILEELGKAAAVQMFKGIIDSEGLDAVSDVVGSLLKRKMGNAGESKSHSDSKRVHSNVGQTTKQGHAGYHGDQNSSGSSHVPTATAEEWQNLSRKMNPQRNSSNQYQQQLPSDSTDNRSLGAFDFSSNNQERPKQSEYMPSAYSNQWGQPQPVNKAAPNMGQPIWNQPPAPPSVSQRQQNPYGAREPQGGYSYSMTGQPQQQSTPYQQYPHQYNYNQAPRNQWSNESGWNTHQGNNFAHYTSFNTMNAAAKPTPPIPQYSTGVQWNSAQNTQNWNMNMANKSKASSAYGYTF